METRPWRLIYGALAALLLLTLCVIAETDGFLRGTVGDFLVVLLLYAGARAIFPRSVRLLPLYIFLFACIVEVGQFLNIPALLGLSESATLSIAVGSVFDWLDIAAYGVGCLVSALIDWQIRKFFQ